MGEIASAHVTIYPKFSGTFGSTVAQQVGVVGTAAGTRMGQQIGAGLTAQAPKIGAGTGAAIGSALKPMLTVAAAGAVVRFAKDSVDSFALLEDATAAAGVVFGDSMDQIIAQSETAATTLGMSKAQVIDAANTFGAYGKAAGLAGTDLAGFSVEMTQLAGDMASFRGTSPEESIQAIGAALRGESEPIRKYGVLLDDATLKNRAMKMGLIDSVKSGITPQQKALAAQAEILAQTTDAQGDFARTMTSTANQTKTATAQFENLKAALGEKLAPAYDEMVAAASGAMSYLEQNPEILEAVGAAANLLTQGFKLAAGVTTQLFGPALALIQGLLSGAAKGLELFVGTLARIPGAPFDWARTAEKDLNTFSESMATSAEGAAALVAGHKAAGTAAAGASVAAFRLLDANKSVGKSATDAAGALQDEATAARAAASAMLTLRGDQRGLEAAIDDATAALKANGKTLDNHTPKGRANQAALDGIATAGLGVVESLNKTGASSARADAAMQKSRTAFIAAATSMGMSKTEARALATSLGLIKPKSAPVKTPGAKSSKTEVDGLKGSLNGLPKSKSVTVTAKINWPSPPGGLSYADAFRLLRGANGFVLNSYAGGGLRENHVAQIARAGDWRLWAEPETGGEAYIPLAASKRSRSLDIWRETGRRLGVQGMADGGVGGGGASNDGLAQAVAQALNGMSIRLMGANRFADDIAGRIEMSSARGV